MNLFHTGCWWVTSNACTGGEHVGVHANHNLQVAEHWCFVCCLTYCLTAALLFHAVSLTAALPFPAWCLTAWSPRNQGPGYAHPLDNSTSCERLQLHSTT